MNRKFKDLSLFGILLILLAFLAPPTFAQLQVQIFDSPIRMKQTLVVDGATTLTGATTQTGALTVAGLVNANGGIAVDTNAFTVADATGNTVIAGTLSVGGGYGSTGCSVSAAGALQCDGAATLGSTLQVDSTLNANGGIAVDTTVFTLNGTTGQINLAPVPDADADNYDNGLTIDHALVGLGTKDRFYGIDIEMTRAAGYDTTNGDHDDAGLKIRMINKSTANATGTTLRGVDVNVKNDNPSGVITNLYGGSFTAQTDTGSPPAGNVSTAAALTAQITANAPITDSLIVGDFRNFRQTATEPTLEYGVQIRNGNTTGTGVDAGLYFKSEAATVGDFGYVIDMNDAAALTADIRLSQGETIDNLTNGQVKIGGILVGGADGSAVFNTQHSVTAAEINAGHTVVTVPDTRIFRLVNVVAVPYGGACGAVTSVDLKAGAVILASYAQANLTQSNYMGLNSTGVTLLADGASFNAQTEDQDITVIKVGSDVTTCTGVMFNLSYALD